MSSPSKATQAPTAYAKFYDIPPLLCTTHIYNMSSFPPWLPNPLPHLSNATSPCYYILPSPSPILSIPSTPLLLSLIRFIPQLPAPCPWYNHFHPLIHVLGIIIVRHVLQTVTPFPSFIHESQRPIKLQSYPIWFEVTHQDKLIKGRHMTIKFSLHFTPLIYIIIWHPIEDWKFYNNLLFQKI